MIEISNLKKSFDNGEKKKYVVDNISFSIKKGEFVSILGPSGSGKSTLLNLISGLEKADSGVISFDDENITNYNDTELTDFRRRKTAYVFQSYYLLPTINVLSNIKMGANLTKGIDVKEIIDSLGLSGFEKKFPYQLSGGEQQRVSIARAIAKNPEVLFCDEPTGALDEKTGREVMKYLLNIQKEKKITLIMVTHNENLAKLSDRIIKMNSGKVILDTINEPSKLEEIGW
ncbi:ABC transporter ATP-binding protein [Acholeplasma sp. OttesenSCG-928-E16]|nr:ABC transporter ATP-binding protein [Acholeplasma sp. OttesenSCG-928-E16]